LYFGHVIIDIITKGVLYSFEKNHSLNAHILPVPVQTVDHLLIYLLYLPGNLPGAAAPVRSLSQGTDYVYYYYYYSHPCSIILLEMVRSHLDYCCPVWSPYRKGDIEALDPTVQKRATKMIPALKTSLTKIA